MSLVTFESASLHLGTKTIFDDLNLQITPEDRIGLIGPNGSGKSTLLKAIQGTQPLDSGHIHISKKIKVGYLPQDFHFETTKTVLEYVCESIQELENIKAQIKETEDGLTEASSQSTIDAIENTSVIMKLSETVADLYEQLTRLEDLYSPHRAQSILSGLGFFEQDFSRAITELSGGWQMRVLLAALLFQQPDVLLLDEPTNHLDMPSVSWFSGFLKKYPHAIVLISHDREFLNEQINRVVSYEPNGIQSGKGNYDRYLLRLEEMKFQLEAKAKKIEGERKKLQTFVDRFGAKASKATQAQSKKKQLEKLEKVETFAQRKTIQFQFPSISESGKEVLQVDSVSKAFGEKKVLENVNLTVKRGDCIALIGRNGAGKTTLLRTLAGELQPENGKVEWGYKTSVAYFAQHHVDALSLDKTVYEEVLDLMDMGGRKQVMAALGALLFSEDDVEKPIRVLSGGERARVALAKILVKPGNVLLMDEPTNHLDLDSSERLKEALALFAGTLIFVSHNRGFVRSLAKRIWHVDHQTVNNYPGSLDDYMSSVQSEQFESGTTIKNSVPSKKNVATKRKKVKEDPGSKSLQTASGPPSSDKTNSKGKRVESAEQRRKRRPLERALASTEEKIAKLEKKKTEFETELNDPEKCKDFAWIQRTTQAFEQTKAELEVLSDKWIEQSEALEQFLADL